MILYIKKKLLTWTDSYDVFDEQDNVKYKIVANLLTTTRKFKVTNANEEEIGIIKRKMISFLPSYTIFKNNIEIGHISKKMSLLKAIFDIDYKGYIAKGDIFNWNFDITDSNSKAIAKIFKEQLHLTNTHRIEILNPIDEVDIILLVIAIEEIFIDN